MSESADEPEGLGGEPSGPDFAGPGYLPPAEPGRSADPPTPFGAEGQSAGHADESEWFPPSDPPDHEPWPVAAAYDTERSPRPRRTTIAVIMVVVGLCLILIATIVILVQRLVIAELPNLRPTAPATSPATPSPSVPATPADDSVGRAMTGLGMTCVREYERPVLNTCRTRPGEPYGEVSWALEDQMVAFKMYHRAKTAADRKVLVQELQRLGHGGLPRAARNKINTAMTKARKKKGEVAITVGWGKILIDYYRATGGFQIDGSRSGVDRVSVPGRPFVAQEATLIKVLGDHHFGCSSAAYTLNCKDAKGSIQIYRYDRSQPYYYLELREVSGRPELLDSLLPVVLRPADREVVQAMINANERDDYFLGAAGGYLMEITSDLITIETVSW